MNKIELGIDWYKKRIDIGDFKRCEEPFISMLELFKYYKSRDTKETLYYLCLMRKLYPYRLEGVYEGMDFFNNNNDFEMAYVFGKAGYKTLNNVNRGYLFKNVSIYKYKFLFLFSLMTYYSEHYTEAYESALLLKDVEMPENIRIRHDENIKVRMLCL